MPAQVTSKQIARKFPSANLSALPTSNPGGGKPWLSGGAVVVGNYAGNTVDWSAIANKPTEFTPTAHTHDDRYYTKSEIDAGYAKLSGGNSFSGNQVFANSLTASGNLSLSTLNSSQLIFGSSGNTNITTQATGFLLYNAPNGAGSATHYFRENGTAYLQIAGGSFEIQGTRSYTFAAGGASAGDIALYRSSSTQLEVNNRTAGGLRDLAVRKLFVDGRQIGPNASGDYFAYIGTSNVGWAIGSNIGFNTGGALGATGATVSLAANGMIGFTATSNNALLGTDTKVGRAGNSILGVYAGDGTTYAQVNCGNIQSSGNLSCAYGTFSARITTAIGASTFASAVFDNFCGVGIRPPATTSTGLHIKGLASQTANLIQCSDDVGNVGFLVKPYSAGSSSLQLGVFGPSGDANCVLGVSATAGAAPTCGFGLGDANTGYLTTSSGHSVMWRLRSDTSGGGITSFAGVHVSVQGGAFNSAKGSIWCNASNVFQFRNYGTSTPAAIDVGSTTIATGGQLDITNSGGTYALRVSSVAADGRMKITQTAGSASYIEFSNSGLTINQAIIQGTGSFGASQVWGTGWGGNSNNLKIIQSSASGADAIMTLKAERYADSTVNGQPKFRFVGKELIFSTGNPDNYDAFNTGWTEQAKITTAGLIVSNNVQVTGYVSSAFRSLSANPTTLDIASGLEQLVKNTTSGELRRWANDGGSMKSILYA